MAIAELIRPESDFCDLATRWLLEERLADLLVVLSERVEFPISIISGYRSKDEQDSLRREGRPAAADDRSTHRQCPATGADVMPQIAITNYVKARLGAEAMFVGLRWGGGSPVDPETGIPSDWNHLDLGRRT